MMEEIFRVLKSEGLVVHLSVPDKSKFWKYNLRRFLSIGAIFVVLDFFTNCYTKIDGSRWWTFNQAKRKVKGKFFVEKVDSEECWYRMDLIYQKQ